MHFISNKRYGMVNTASSFDLHISLCLHLHIRPGGYLTFCHPYRWHLFVYKLCVRTYRFTIANSEMPKLLPLLLVWHATRACQRSNVPGNLYRACEITCLPPLLLSFATR